MAPAIADAGNYYRWVFSAVERFLGRAVLEIGPGWGRMVSLVEASGRSYRAVDIDEQVIRDLKARFPRKEERFTLGDISSRGTAEKLAGAGIDTILMMNVLEHVEHDGAFLRGLKTNFPGCRVVLQLPALPALYGRLDRDAGHFRRYTARSARAALEAAGYAPEEIFYFNFLGAITWFLASRVAGFSLDSNAVNNAVNFNDRFLVPISLALDPLTRRLAGQSVIAVAR